MQQFTIFLLTLLILWFHLIIAPFNKVEESFFIQATHDLIFEGAANLAAFDHFKFPGVVPRSFVGPLFLAGPAWIVGSLLDWLDPTTNKLYFLFGTRLTLAVYCAASLSWVALGLIDSKSNVNNAPASTYFILLSVCQFHLMFWGSRTIANTFALVLFQLALGFLLRCTSSSPREANSYYNDALIFCLTFCCVVFRAELVPLSIALILFAYSKNRQTYSFWRVIVVGTTSSLVSILVTVGIDSYFWQRWVWPELEVFLFNGIDGKSVEWGVSPWHYYFTHLLPRILPLSLCVITSVLIWQGFLRLVAKPGPVSVDLLSPLIFIGLAVFHISVLSLISHKEWRFIIYSIPLLNISAALLIRTLEPHKTTLRVLRVALIAAFCASMGMLYLSHLNYPGGVALARLHKHVHGPTRVHIDATAAMTGVSRFGESSVCCVYSKNEDLKPADFVGFDWILTGTPAMHAAEVWVVVDVVEGYAGIEVREPVAWVWETVNALTRGEFVMLQLPIRARMEDAVFIMKRA